MTFLQFLTKDMFHRQAKMRTKKELPIKKQFFLTIWFLYTHKHKNKQWKD